MTRPIFIVCTDAFTKREIAIRCDLIRSVIAASEGESATEITFTVGPPEYVSESFSEVMAKISEAIK